MGYCSYQRNPSELYRDTKPGQAPETICGARTFPAVDEPEVVVVRTGMTSDGAVYEYVPTGRSVARSQDDPYCPRHGGSPEPPPPPVTMAELEHAWAAYQDLTARFQEQPGGALAAPAVPPAQLASPPAPPAPEARAPGSQLPAPGLAPLPVGRTVSVEDTEAARAAFEALAARARAEAGAQ